MEVDRLLKRLHKNKPELLMVLDRERRGPQGMIRLRYRCVFQRRWGLEIFSTTACGRVGVMEGARIHGTNRFADIGAT